MPLVSGIAYSAGTPRVSNRIDGRPRAPLGKRDRSTTESAGKCSNLIPIAMAPANEKKSYRRNYDKSPILVRLSIKTVRFTGERTEELEMHASRMGVEDRIDRKSIARLYWEFFQPTTVMRQGILPSAVHERNWGVNRRSGGNLVILKSLAEHFPWESSRCSGWRWGPLLAGPFFFYFR